MTHLEAWAHFYALWRLLPARERKALPAPLRAKIGLAQQDFQGKRRNRNGEVLGLGPKRVAAILLAVSGAMPGTFAYTHHLLVEEWFESRK